jgi:DNA-binding IclR family transcriptional regulator
MSDSNVETRKIGATQKSFEIIETLNGLDGAGVSEIADQVNLARGTVHAHLASLVDSGYVIKDNNSYKLSLKFLNLGVHIRNKKDNFPIVRESVDELANRTGLRVQYMVEEHSRAVYLYRAVGNKAVPTSARIGKPRYLHTTAAGKAILASYSSDTVDNIIETVGLPGVTKHTVTDVDTLRTELVDIQKNGYATNFQESFENLSAIGAAIKPGEISEMGAISISGPCHAIQKNDTKIDMLCSELMESIEKIELNIDYSD